MADILSDYGPWLLAALIVVIVIIAVLAQLASRLRGSGAGTPPHTATHQPSPGVPQAAPQTPTQQGGAFFSSIVVNGQTYARPEDMPPDIRRAYEQSMAVFADKDGNGVPDLLDNLGAAAGASAQVIDLSGGDRVARLQELKRMLDAGLITSQEYEAKKGEILAKL